MTPDTDHGHPIIDRACSNKILDTSEYSEESDIRSLTDSDRYRVHLETTSDYSEHALNILVHSSKMQ